MGGTKKIRICGADIGEFTAVLPKNPSETEKCAAEELCAHIREAAGAELSVSDRAGDRGIYIGRAAVLPREGIKYDGYVIATDEKNLYLYGAADRGALYAVYRFLEKYIGFRKYEPEVGRLLPGNAEIPENLRDASNPAFEYRRTNWGGHLRSAQYAAWSGMNAVWLPETEKYGGAQVFAGGNGHTFEALCDPKIYFEEHPEYYSLFEGERIPAGNTFEKPYGQLCLSNPEVLAIVTENALKQLRAAPDATIIDISQNDNSRYCRCEACAAADAQEGSPSGLLLRFVNAVAEAVEREFPEVLVQTFAYDYTRIAPKITRPRENIIIRYCTIEACFRHPLEDESCEKNAGRFAKELKDWGRIASKLSIWDYTRNFSCYFAPFPIFEALRKNISLFARSNALHVFEQDSEDQSYTGDIGGMKAYLIARLLWDPDMSDGEYRGHTEDFLEGYYGPGWRNVDEYLSLLHEATREEHFGCFERMDCVEGRTEYFPAPYQQTAEEKYGRDNYLTKFKEKYLDRSLALWARALSMAENDGQRDRVRRSMLSVEYLDLFCRPRDREKMGAAERAEYEKRAGEFFRDKARFDLRTNIWTNRYGH